MKLLCFFEELPLSWFYWYLRIHCFSMTRIPFLFFQSECNFRKARYSWYWILLTTCTSCVTFSTYLACLSCHFLLCAMWVTCLSPRVTRMKWDHVNKWYVTEKMLNTLCLSCFPSCYSLVCIWGWGEKEHRLSAAKNNERTNNPQMVCHPKKHPLWEGAPGSEDKATFKRQWYIFRKEGSGLSSPEAGSSLYVLLLAGFLGFHLWLRQGTEEMVELREGI